MKSDKASEKWKLENKENFYYSFFAIVVFLSKYSNE